MKTATLAQAQQLLNLIAKKEVGTERVQALIESGILADLLDVPLEDVAKKKAEDVRIGTREKLGDILVEAIVPKRCVVKVMQKEIKADGGWVKNFDEVSPVIINKGLPNLEGAIFLSPVTVEFVHYRKKEQIPYTEAWELIPKEFRAVNLFELISLGIQYPQIQRIRRVVGLTAEYIDPLDQRVCPMLVSRRGSHRKVGYTAEVIKDDLLAVVYDP